MAIWSQDYPYSLQSTLDDGNPVVISVRHKKPGFTVWANPASGDTVRVEYRVDTSAPWKAWSNGDVTSYADLVFVGPISDLRFTRTAGAGTTSAYGIA